MHHYPDFVGLFHTSEPLRRVQLDTLLRLPTTEAPRYNEGSRDDWKNLFAIKRVRYIEVLCHIFYYHWGKENRSLLAVLELRRELGRVSNIN